MVVRCCLKAVCPLKYTVLFLLSILYTSKLLRVTAQPRAHSLLIGGSLRTWCASREPCSLPEEPVFIRIWGCLLAVADLGSRGEIWKWVFNWDKGWCGMCVVPPVSLSEGISPCTESLGWHAVDDKTHLLQLRREARERRRLPQGSITGDHLEGQWYLKGSSYNPSNLKRILVLMIICDSGSCSRWSEVAGYVRLEQTQCPCCSDPFVQGSGEGSEGIWTHFINPAESDIFKENHPRVCYLYMEYFQSSLSPLSFNYSGLTPP